MKETLSMRTRHRKFPTMAACTTEELLAGLGRARARSRDATFTSGDVSNALKLQRSSDRGSVSYILSVLCELGHLENVAPEKKTHIVYRMRNPEALTAAALDNGPLYYNALRNGKPDQLPLSEPDPEPESLTRSIRTRLEAVEKSAWATLAEIEALKELFS